jgi:hypothetical protein
MDKESLKERSKDKKPSKKEKPTLADYAAKKLGWKKAKLPEGWCEVIFKK